MGNRFQRVLLNGQTSEWLPVKVGVPKGSILGPLFFLIYINDLFDKQWSICIWHLVSVVFCFCCFCCQLVFTLVSLVPHSNISAYELNNKYLNELISGKCHSILIWINKLRKGCFPRSYMSHVIQKYLLIMHQFFVLIDKNI